MIIYGLNIDYFCLINLFYVFGNYILVISLIHISK